MKPTAKQIRRITHLATYHKKARVRKKNKKRLQKYAAQTLSIPDIVAALRQFGKMISDAFTMIGRGIRQMVENANRCVCCNRIIPEGRQVCPVCEGSTR